MDPESCSALLLVITCDCNQPDHGDQEKRDTCVEEAPCQEPDDSGDENRGQQDDCSGDEHCDDQYACRQEYYPEDGGYTIVIFETDREGLRVITALKSNSEGAKRYGFTGI